jgi:hypothetical protein
MTDDDFKLCVQINDTRDPVKCASLIGAYYHDLGRAERTSRDYIWLHIGMLVGCVAQLHATLNDRTKVH